MNLFFPTKNQPGFDKPTKGFPPALSFSDLFIGFIRFLHSFGTSASISATSTSASVKANSESNSDSLSHDMTGFPTKIPHLLITSSLDHGQLITGLMSTWANHKELLSRGIRDSCSLGFECSRLQHHKFGPMVELEHKPRVDWRLLPRAGQIPNTWESSKVHFFLNHVTLRPSDDANYLVPICNLPDPIWEHHGHHCIETPLHCHVGIYHLNVKDSCKTHCWTTWLFLFDEKDKNKLDWKVHFLANSPETWNGRFQYITWGAERSHMACKLPLELPRTAERSEPLSVRRPSSCLPPVGRTPELPETERWRGPKGGKWM